MSLKTKLAVIIYVAVSAGFPTFLAGSLSAATLTNATLFDVDNTGTNLGSTGGVINFGVWTTQTGTKNTPSNFVALLYLSTNSNPSPGDFITPGNPISIPLANGANTFFFFADSNDTRGGTFGFGFNLWLNAASAGSPSISAFEANGTSSFSPDGTSGCTPAFDANCTTGANRTSFTSAGQTITLTAFSVSQVGGGTSLTCVDKVGTNNSTGAVVNTPNGICDTTGSFTLTVSSTAVPEPGTWALMMLGAGVVGARRLLRRQ